MTNLDHDYLRTYFNISPYVENITEYIAGFVSKTVMKKINCNTCKEVLTRGQTDNILINLKDRNDALIKPSKDVSYICAVSEKHIRCIDFKNMCGNNFINKLYLKIKSEVFRSNSVFQTDTMNNHIKHQSLYTNHKDQLLTLTIYTFCKFKIKTYCKSTKKKI